MSSNTEKTSRKDSLAKLVVMAVKPLIDGLKLTLKFLFSRPVTMLYPYEKREMPPGYRGLHVLKVDPQTQKMKCIGCTLCARACPDHLITIETSPGEDKKRKVDVFDVDISRCMFCNLCAEACPHAALELSSKYELACTKREGMIYHKEDLLEKPDVTKRGPAGPGPAEPESTKREPEKPESSDKPESSASEAAA